jgi:hypothetical protein
LGLLKLFSTQGTRKKDPIEKQTGHILKHKADTPFKSPQTDWRKNQLPNQKNTIQHKNTSREKNHGFNPQSPQQTPQKPTYKEPHETR